MNSGGSGFSISFTGLVLTIGAGQLEDAAGAGIAVPAGTVTLRDNATNYVVVSLFDLSYHAFTRTGHTAGVCIATVVTSGGVVTSVSRSSTFKLLNNPIEPFTSKLRNGQLVRILMVGDSITNGAGGTPYFYDLCWNAANAAAGYNYPNVANITLSRLGYPGASAIAGMAIIADLNQQCTGGTNNAYSHTDQSVVRMPFANSERTTPVPYIGSNRYVMALPDAVFIALGTNYDARNFVWLEAQARFWRKKGVPVCLITCNRRYDGPSSATPADPRWELFAASVGAALCDTAEFMEEAYYNYLNNGGTNPYSDLVHPSTYGQALWAQAITGMVNAYRHPFCVTELQEKFTTITTTSAIRPSAHAQLQILPLNLVGAPPTGTTPWPFANLRVLLAQQAATAGRYEIGVGQAVIGSFPFVTGSVWAIVENQAGDNATYSVTQPAGTWSTGSITGSSIPMQFIEIIPASTVQSFATANSFYSGTKNKALPVSVGFQLNATSGNIKLVGFLFETPIVREIPRSEWDLIGTWAQEAGDFDTSCRLTYTDTSGDRMIIRAPDCHGVAFMTRVGNAAGQITVVADTLSAYAPLEMYVNNVNQFNLPLVFVPGAWPNFSLTSTATIPLTNNRRDHMLTVTLSGVNGSAAATSAGIRRLGVSMVYALEFS